MSVFGGDSWGREAQYRKRRLDDLLLDAAAAGDPSSYRKLPSGKYACLVCPHNPVLDTPLMLSMHMKARRHLDEKTKLKQREEERQNKMNKRIALSVDSSISNNGNHTNTPTKQTKPLIEKTRKATFELLDRSRSEQSTGIESQTRSPTGVPYDLTNSTVVQMEAFGKDVVQLSIDYREHRERELKFTEAGWKRDCHGRWFRDENVEFDSDEEDPNVFFETRDWLLE